jgi:hypothetical protein
MACAIPIRGSVEPTTPLGQFVALNMTIGDTATRFELTGPDYSWFAFGFDTTTMFGYSLIIQGTDATRTAVEQNLRGIGNPGSPQATQNISIINTLHDATNNLTTIVVERPNETGDPNDPVFSTNMTALNVIWASDGFASPSSPNPILAYHDTVGRGFATIAFSPIPEPANMILLATAVAGFWPLVRRWRQ